MTGYSNTPLHQKLGIKAGDKVYILGTPSNYEALISPIPNRVKILVRLSNELDLVHIFTQQRQMLATALSKCLPHIKRDGAIWVSWPKKSSGVASEVTEDTIRDVALPLGLVDVKVCAVDEVWSALKLVIRKELRVESGPPA